ncbi:MAG: three-Cys-motif partner protein TcmP [Ignavibacteriales bacterium]|nr:three-Cys-motif partner protein TcmP [Ignavibacteriales bacterium]
MGRKRFDIIATEDRLLTPSVGAWAEKKYRLLHYYDRLFATGIKNRFRHRVYFDLFSGPGKALIEQTGKTVYTSPLLAMNLPDQFTKYLFCDEREDFLESLKSRVETHFDGVDAEYFNGDCNTEITRILRKLPPPSRRNTMLTFCFVDPFNLEFKFSTVQALNSFRVDFLILLATDMDGARNRVEYELPTNTRIDEFLGDRDWRIQWQIEKNLGISFSTFLLNSFADRMIGLDYLPKSRSRMVHIRSDDRNLPLYRLAFFSKHDLAYTFWDKVLDNVLEPELPFE